MSQRVTRAELDLQIRHLNDRFQRSDGLKFGLDSAYGKLAFGLFDKNGCGRNLSPRLSTGELMEWIRAFWEGCYCMDQLWCDRIKNDDDLVFEVRKAGL